MAKIYDVTIPIHENMPAFPGDEKIFTVKDILRVENGDPYSIRKISMLTHTGTHMDAPGHYIPYGKNLELIDISKLIGPAILIEIKNPKEITLDEIREKDIESNTIVLFKTRNSEIWKQNKKFEENYVYLTGEAAKFLVSKEVKSVGIDYLSIDSFTISSPDAHLALLGNDIPIIEGLDFSHVPEGKYKFTCLPLKMSGVDGSPVRAILEELL